LIESKTGKTKRERLSKTSNQIINRRTIKGFKFIPGGRKREGEEENEGPEDK
jgi:hypothetical protein